MIRLNAILIASLAAALLAGCNKSDSHVYDITRYGARAEANVDNATAIQKAIDECSGAGGGTVLIPAGREFMTGPLHLKSRVNLHLEPGSRLLANPDEDIYKESAFGDNVGEGMMWLSGRDLESVSITGTGTIDGNGVAFMGAELEDSYELKPFTVADPRPHVLTLINCNKVSIKDVTLTGSAY